jgi:hypothetical protein
VPFRLEARPVQICQLYQDTSSVDVIFADQSKSNLHLFNSLIEVLALAVPFNPQPSAFSQNTESEWGRRDFG